MLQVSPAEVAVSGAGPAYLKIGSRILYRLADIEEFEQKQLVNLTAVEKT